MAIESNLPENVKARTHQQHVDAGHQLRRFNEALWHAQQALSALVNPALPLYRADEATLHQLRITVKVLEADKTAAERYEQSAFHIYCEAHDIDPNEEQPEDETATLRKAALSNGRP